MHRPVRQKGLLALALMAVAAIPASAADIALVIDNQSLNSSQATALSDGLEAAGYDVISRDGSRADLAEAFSDAAGRIDGDGRLMLLWFGETRTSGNETWLLPEDFDGSTVVDAEFGAISLSLLTEMAAALPGRSAVILGLPAAEGDIGDPRSHGASRRNRGGRSAAGRSSGFRGRRIGGRCGDARSAV